MKRIH